MRRWACVVDLAFSTLDARRGQVVARIDGDLSTFNEALHDADRSNQLRPRNGRRAG
jgi:hypothetical protein